MQNDSAKFKTDFKNRVYAWVLRLIRFIDTLSPDAAARVVGKQLLRSRTSILANYGEANSASSKRDFINFFTHSLKSANESNMWRSLLIDTKKGDGNESAWLLGELTEIANIIASSILTMKGKR